MFVSEDFDLRVGKCVAQRFERGQGQDEVPYRAAANHKNPVHSNRSSSSSTRRSNNRNVLSIGDDVAISTPAALNVSSGNFEPPERRKFRYASTLPGSPESTRRESATA